MVQRKVELTGDSVNIARVIAIINQGIDFRYRAQVNASGEIEIDLRESQDPQTKSRILEGPVTDEQSFFTSQLRTMVEEQRTTRIRVVSTGRPIGGSYDLEMIDIEDIEELGIGQLGWDARAALLHEFIEQHEKQLSSVAELPSARQKRAHEQGLIVEQVAVGALIESDTGFIVKKYNPDGTLDGKRIVIWSYPNGPRIRNEVTVFRNDIIDIKRKRLSRK
jgi:hypothetical protein